MTDVSKSHRPVSHSVARLAELEAVGMQPFFNPGSQTMMWVNDRTGTVHYGNTPPHSPQRVAQGGRWRLVYVTKDEA